MLCSKTSLIALAAFVTALSSAYAADTPRPEFPEPQFMRSSWQSLNGSWEFAFDDNNQGLRNGWNASGLPAPRSITVPYCFESKLSGIADTSFHPVFWYSKTFEVPRSWKG